MIMHFKRTCQVNQPQAFLFFAIVTQSVITTAHLQTIREPRLAHLQTLGASPRFRVLLYSTAVLNLTAVVLYSFYCLSLSTFCRAKSSKNARHTGATVGLFFVQELLS